MKHYVLQKGVYVYERYLDGKNVLVFMNGTSNEVEIDLGRYTESIKGKSESRDVISGKIVALRQTLKLAPKEILLL